MRALLQYCNVLKICKTQILVKNSKKLWKSNSNPLSHRPPFRAKKRHINERNFHFNYAAAPHFQFLLLSFFCNVKCSISYYLHCCKFLCKKLCIWMYYIIFLMWFIRLDFYIHSMKYVIHGSFFFVFRLHFGFVLFETNNVFYILLIYNNFFFYL